MSQLTPDHVSGATTNSGNSSQPVSTANLSNNTKKKRARNLSHDTEATLPPKTPTQQPSQVSDEEGEEETRRKKIFSTPTRGNSQGKYPLFSLPSQNLDASIHASHHNPNMQFIPNFGSMPPA